MAANVGEIGVLLSAQNAMGPVFQTVQRQASGMATGIQSAMSQVNMKMVAAGGAMTAFAGMSAKTAMDFESTMTKSLMMFGDITAEQEGLLKETAKTMGTKYAVGAESAAGALYGLGSAGLSATQASETLGEVLKFASTSTLDVKQATEVSLTAMKNFGYEAEDLGKVTSRLQLIESNAQVTTTQMADTFSYAAPIAAKAGMKISDLGAFIGIMGDAGIRGSKAGTALRRAMTNLIKPTGQSEEALKTLGLTTNIYQKNNADMMKSLFQVLKAMKKMPKADRQAAAAKLFGTRAVAGMTAVIDENIQGVKERAKAINKSGEADRRFVERQDTMSFQLQKVKAQFQEFQLSLASALLPVLKSLTKAVNTVMGAFNALPGPVKTALGLLMGIGGPVLLLIGLLPLLAQGFGVVTGATEALTLSMMTNPLFIGVAAFAGLIILLKKFGLLGDVIGVIKSAFTKLGGFLKGVFEPILNAVGKAVGFLKEHGKTLLKIALFPIALQVKIIIKIFKTLYNVLKGPVSSAVSKVAGGIQWLWKNALEPVVNFIKNMAIAYFKAWWMILEPIFSWVKKVAGVIKGPLVGAFKAIVAPIKAVIGFFGTLVGWVKDLWNWVWGGSLVPALEKLKEAFNLLVAPIKLEIRLFETLIGWVEDLIGWLWGGSLIPILEKLADVFGVVGSAIGGVIGVFKDLSGVVGGAAGAVSDAVGGISDAVGGVGDAVGGAADKVGDVFGFSPGGQLEESLKHAQKTAERFAPRISAPLGEIGAVGVGAGRIPRTGRGVSQQTVNIDMGMEVTEELTRPKMREKMKQMESIAHEQSRGLPR